MSLIIEKARLLHSLGGISDDDVVKIKVLQAKNPDKMPKTPKEIDEFLNSYAKQKHYANIRSIKRNIQFFFWATIISVLIIVIVTAIKS